MYRGCAFKCTYGDGCRDSVFKYKSHIQRDGSLDVTLTDPAYNVEIVLSYKYSRDSDVITKYITVINNSGADIKIERIMSGELMMSQTQTALGAVNFNSKPHRLRQVPLYLNRVRARQVIQTRRSWFCRKMQRRTAAEFILPLLATAAISRLRHHAISSAKRE